MDLPQIDLASVKGRRILVRADLNVPMKENGTVSDDTRIRRFADGMKPLLAAGARLVILTHFGRPEPGTDAGEYSVEPLIPSLAAALGRPVRFCPELIGEEAVARSRGLSDGTVMLCENLRLSAGETANDLAFAAQLAKLGDICMNDAFSCAHRAHASTEALAHLLPAVAGPLMVEEIEALSAALECPKRPAVAVVGGAKVSSKIAVLKNLVQKVDHIIIGGGMANTFLYADGAPMGRSLHEADQIETVREIRALAQAAGCSLHLPEDVVAAYDFAAGAAHDITPAAACPKEAMILDAGPRALKRFQSVLTSCKTILWNGPLGAFELSPFDLATRHLAETAADLTRQGLAVSVAGGGDTVAALNMAGVSGDFTYVSSAGGAFLEWLEGKTLPGIAALQGAAKAA
ncbi:phosphoglycerate kinase [Phaeobacter sp. PT47_59]|uniref:phosphoglycerate kinase n=1 Tax=Phaeobacter sp. PT47_59 TaxID=3029979 RepID=UPI00238098B8|nr:phosphoglycerate kinase [Phaeobacter sp. PT47_59]MDE4172681.1 phosphoglycerate kinase [Phaeobacter sp. PT47_59]